MDKQINEYDKEPIYYCPRCLSLGIKSDIADYCYCNDCGSTRVDITTIFEWEKLYKNRYGVSYLDK